VKAHRAATLAELDKLTDEKPKPAPKAEPVASDNAEAEAAADDAAPESPPAKVDATEDPETAKRLAKVNEAEKRNRDKLAADRAALDTERKKLDEDRKAAEAERAEMDAFRKLRERAKLDPVAALKALGVDDLDYAARQAYAQSKAKADDPANREAAARALAAREQADTIEKLTKRLDAYEARDQQRQQQEQVRQQADKFMADLGKAAQANPVAKHFHAQDPEDTDRQFRRIAADLYEETGDIPDTDDVLARFEKQRRDEAKRYGVNLDTILSPATAKTKKTEEAAAKKNAAKTLGNDLSTSSVPRRSQGNKESRAETLALLESGQLDS
jgi:hypothetical protein